MKKLEIVPVALGLMMAASSAIMAQDAGPDTDGDGLVSLEEFAAAYPDLTEESFSLADTNADGMLDEDELAAAVDAGILPMNEN